MPDESQARDITRFTARIRMELFKSIAMVGIGHIGVTWS